MVTTLPYLGSDTETEHLPIGLCPRLDLACVTGIDTDLVLGAPGESLEETRVRLGALLDMIDAAFITPGDVAHAWGRAVILGAELGLATVIEEIQGEEDADGYEDEPEGLAAGWAA